MRRFLWLFMACSLAFLASCQPDDPNQDPTPDPVIPVVPDTPSGSGISGVYVLNEGNFTFANASLSYYDLGMDSVFNNLFYKANNAPLGDVAQSMALSDGKLYIVVNNGNYIYKVDAATISFEAKLQDFYSPREMCIVAPNKAYVSDLMGTALWIVNPQDMTHIGSVEMGKSTEKMVPVGAELYVSNWSNYYVPGMEKNTVQVVDINNDVKVAEIQVGKEPNTMALDKDNHVWVLCEGAVWDEDGENPSLWEINPMLKTAEKRYAFEGSAMALRSAPTGDQFYLIYNNEVRRFDIGTMALSETFCIAPGAGSVFYNIAVEPKSGDVYVTDARNYMMNGTVYRYSNDGVLLTSFEAGVIPDAMLFK